MPSVSKKQARFMAAAAHNPLFAKKAGIKQSVAKDFNQADSALSNADKTLANTGAALRGTISRIASGAGKRRPMKKAEGGKVAAGLSALRQLAKKFEEALDMQDTDTANMIARKMEAIEPGSSKEVLSTRAANSDEQKARSLKLSTFAKGGKVTKKAMGGEVAEDEDEEAPAPKPKAKQAKVDPTAIGNRVIAIAKKEGCSVNELLSRMEASYEEDETTGEDDETE